ncbi:Mu transposase domain-containing protein [Pendulispora albinea]|uniref:Mu transposase domain-containing protein n=1 Tax=Pendulispora albinea TaxID=2741071 RepID=UPI00374E013D
MTRRQAPRARGLVLWKKARIHRDAHAQFEGRLYSVPWRLMGKDVWIKVTKGIITICADFDPKLRRLCAVSV